MSDQGSDEDRAMAFLRANVTPATAEEVAEALGIRVPTTQRLLGRLVRLARARRAGGKRFTASRFDRG